LEVTAVIAVKGKNGRTVYTILHPAHNPNFTESAKTPLLVMAHGGPIDHANATMKLNYVYFTPH
jgi:dipeptidyl aminopeptidase/acylaminoacyl peptidase